MTVETLPLTRLVPVDRLPAKGERVRIEASEAEREALARAFGLPAVHALVGRFELEGGGKRVGVTGTVEGRVTRTCVVTLEPFEQDVHETVEVDFAPATAPVDEAEAEARKLDPPDEIVDGKIDLGALTAEFLALGLDPYPKKPGVAFEPIVDSDAQSPFAKLKGLATGDEKG